MRAGAWCLVLQLAAASALAAPPSPSTQPVFYQRFPERAQPGDLELLRQGRVRVQHYPPLDVATFRWERDATTDYTWWMQMQELRFLLPAIDSNAPRDRALVRAWVQRWYDAHMLPTAATDRWGEPMSVAYRAMVLVRVVTLEEARPDADRTLVANAKRALRAHQEYLSLPEHFDAASNHGMIDALGLFETTRVVPDPAIRSLACARMQGIVSRTVSAPGLACEHAPYYHFVMMRWISQAAAYVRGLPGVPSSLTTVLDATLVRMRLGAYFLQDHAGGIPQIGDTDSCRVQDRDGDFRVAGAPRGETRCYDPDAGYAVYKGNRDLGDGRYVVFRIPTRSVDLNYHMHADALAVYAGYDGETLLGDGGRYSYAASEARSYFVSQAAHNVVMPASRLGNPVVGIRLADTSADRSRTEAAAWSGRMRQGSVTTSRQVTVPAGDHTVEVLDTLRVHGAGGGGALLLWNIGESVRDVKPARFRWRRNVWSWRLRTQAGREAVLRLEVVEGKAGVRLARGEKSPLLGWYSPAQGVMRPAPVIVVTAPLESNTVLRTTLELDGGAKKR